MGKMKQWAEDLDYDEPHFYYEGKQEYYELMEEEAVKNGDKAYQHTPQEEKYYQQYMEGTLCHTHSVRDALGHKDGNSKDGRLSTGEKGIPKYRKRRSKK